MRRSLPLAGFVLLSLPALARADDRPLLQRIAERTPAPRTPVEHTAARAGNPLAVHNHAVPSVTRFDYGGYVGGATIKNNSLTARGPASATGPLCDGVYGTDYAGVRANLGRLFLASSNDPSRGPTMAKLYSPEGPRVTDVFALRPFRKAVLAKHEDDEKRKHAAEGHGAGGEGKGGGH
ncbi:MAG: hypothetical protein FJ304_08880 [Planctomycetes bacterium]|nr:hypothetical protein [Planctomycetota bacterium]